MDASAASLSAQTGEAHERSGKILCMAEMLSYNSSDMDGAQH
jgi:hypothetical protein